MALSCLAFSSSSLPDPPLSPPPDLSTLVSFAGCGADSPTGLVSGFSVNDGDGRTRRFDVFATPAYRHAEAAPLVFLFHGAGGSKDDAWSKEFVHAMAKAGDPAVIVIPQGVAFQRYGIGWDQRCAGYDMPFYDEMIRAVSRRYCIDPKRIFASGFSWGADMVDALACCRGDTLRAVAPFSGDETDANASCATQRYPAARLRYGSVYGERGDGAYTRSQFVAATDFFRKAQSCSADADPVSPTPCRAFRGCSAPVLSCEFTDMGHIPPAASEAADTWAFFKSLK